MISLFLVFSESGDIRLMKFYEELDEARRRTVSEALIRRVCARSGSNSSEIFDCADLMGPEALAVYRRLRDHFMLFCIDDGESPLCILDLIDAFVFTLRLCFGDSDKDAECALVERTDEVHVVLGEMVHGGLILEVEPSKVAQHVRAQLSGESAPSSSVKSFLSKLTSKFRK